MLLGNLDDQLVVEILPTFLKISEQLWDAPLGKGVIQTFTMLEDFPALTRDHAGGRQEIRRVSELLEACVTVNVPEVGVEFQAGESVDDLAQDQDIDEQWNFTLQHDLQASGIVPDTVAALSDSGGGTEDIDPEVCVG